MEFIINPDNTFVKELLPLFESDESNKIWMYHFKRQFGCGTKQELDEKINSAKNFNANTVNRVVLYPTQDYNEIEHLYFKYMALSPNEKLNSDTKAQSIFGMQNRQIYEFVKDNVTEPEEKRDEDKHIVKDEEMMNKSDSILTNDFPILTPEELIQKVDEDYSCFTESESGVIKKWRAGYALLGNGISIQNYKNLNNNRISILRKAIYENNTNAILQCGWIPGIEFNSENRVKASKIVKEKLEKKYNIISYESLEESSNDTDDNKKAVSIVFVAGTSRLAKTIRKVQGTQFSHAAISLDDDLSRIYSYNKKSGFDGFTYESINGYIKDGVQKMGVYTFLVSDKVYNNLEKAIEKFNLYIDKTKYSILNLLTIPINIPLDMDMKMVCSEFVDKVLKAAELDLTNKKSSLVSPRDLIRATGSKSNIVEIFNGNPKKFKSKEIEKKIKKIRKSNLSIYEFVEYDDMVITEAKSLPVQFDSKGNLLIKNLRKINFEQEYANSHRLLKEYEKTDSYDPMKFELAKMQFFITLLEKKIFKNGKDKSVNELKVRARFLNDFKKYLKLVNTNEPSFNFTEYYEQTPFNDALIQIDKDTLKYGFKALKYMIK